MNSSKFLSSPERRNHQPRTLCLIASGASEGHLVSCVMQPAETRGLIPDEDPGQLLCRS